MTEHDNPNLTIEELRAIRALKRLAKSWPQSLMLFSQSGSLVVIRSDEQDLSVEKSQLRYVADIPGIPNDGGDW